jgi:EAL domain-containing protein (putative c-di-GMP-specific phosphodiesterase class I)
LARLGGDEFGVLIEGVQAPSEAAKKAERMVGLFRESFVVDGREFVIRPRIGIALGTARQKTTEELLREADTAMYQAKGRDEGYRVFDPEMYDQALKRLQLESDLRHGIEAEEFVVHYQPVMNLQTGEVWGAEALLRWNHPERGLLEPSQFVEVAEESGLIVPIGRQVLEQVCELAKELHQRDPRIPLLVLCVNVSARQLEHSEYVQGVERVLRRTGLEGSCLCLEITETVFIKAATNQSQIFERLKGLGVRLSIDDFGVGYSSLSYLKRLPADILKVDKSFIKGLGGNVEDTAIVQMVVELAHTLGMETVGEGVESEEQVEQLREMGCDFGQGYYLAKPLSLEDGARFLSS